MLRMGRFDKVRPMRVTLISQMAAWEILERRFRLTGDKELGEGCIKKSLNEEERNKVKELQQ